MLYMKPVISVIALTLYCHALGHETKSMLNSNGPRYKRSTLERSVNVNVLYCGVLLFVMCLIGALGKKKEEVTSS